MNNEPRHLRVATCKECGECKNNMCAPVKGPLRKYSGIRLTSDGFDCALPVSIDSHSYCSYACLYCFANFLTSHREAASTPVGQTSLKTLESIFAGKGGKNGQLIRKALRYHKRNDAGYPCAVQLGALTDPMDNIERQQGWLLEFMDIAIKYNQPVRMSTKGRLACLPEYQEAFAKAPHLFWVAFSIITPDDDLIARLDPKAPNASQRIEAMAALSKLGVSTSLRFRPMLPGASDSTPRHPKAYKELIERCAEAGAKAVSYEVAFMPGMPTKDIRAKWAKIEQLTNVPMGQIYERFGRRQACTRPSYTWTEGIMHAVAEEAHKNQMSVGVSDPVWKQLGDYGCCCGISPDDPVFGNWSPENATNALLRAKADPDLTIGPADVIPEYAHDILYAAMCNLGAGTARLERKHDTWADKLRDNWNEIAAERGPLTYFQGALEPVDRVNGDLYYKYKGLKRQNKPPVFWSM